MVHTQNEILLNCKQEWNCGIHGNIDETGGCYVKQNMPDTERQASHDLIFGV